MWLRRTIGLSLALLLVTAVTIVKQAHSAQPQPNSSAKAKHGKTGTVTAHKTATRDTAGKPAPPHTAARAEAPAAAPEHGPPDQYIGSLQVTGHPEIGSAAWYGPRHLGHRTASGDRLDDVHATAAHRSLPLNSLARVTNLKNGRSVVVKVTDRGPWRSSLLIDVSPKAAEELDMKRAGIVPVRIESVSRATPKPQLASGHAAGVN
jgi:peptidoglycan lytic transglycosylase